MKKYCTSELRKLANQEECRAQVTKISARMEKDGYHEHHTSLTYGYMQRTNIYLEPRPYNGMFGVGYTLERPVWNTAKYHEITYYIKEVK